MLSACFVFCNVFCSNNIFISNFANFLCSYETLLLCCLCIQVLDLQTKLANLTAWSDKLKRNITLEDICFSPLYPDNPKCAIMSALNYFQNNPDNLAKTMPDDYGFIGADYTSHFSICAKYASSSSSLSHDLVSCQGIYVAPQ